MIQIMYLKNPIALQNKLKQPKWYIVGLSHYSSKSLGNRMQPRIQQNYSIKARYYTHIYILYTWPNVQHYN